MQVGIAEISLWRTFFFFFITQTNLILSWEAIPLNIQQKQQCTEWMIIYAQ